MSQLTGKHLQQGNPMETWLGWEARAADGSREIKGCQQSGGLCVAHKILIQGGRDLREPVADGAIPQTLNPAEALLDKGQGMVRLDPSLPHLDDEGDVGVVHASRRHVRGEHDLRSAVAEGGGRLGALRLALAAVHLQHGRAHGRPQLAAVGRHGCGGEEHNDLQPR